MSPWKLAAVFCAVAITMVGAPAMALTFATERTDPTPRSPSDLLLPGLVNVYSDGGANDTDALSFGRSAAGVPPFPGPGQPVLLPGVQFYFSVDPFALGATVMAVPTAVQVEATPPPGGPPVILLDQSADVYLTSMGQIGNSHYSDGDGLAVAGAGAGPGPNLGLIEPGVAPYNPPNGTPPGDVNALDMRSQANFMGLDTFFYTVVASGPAATDPAGLAPPSGANIFLTTYLPATGYHAQRSLYASAAQLGLQQTDDIDGLVVFEDGIAGFNRANDYVFYSLAPGSPTLGMLDPQFSIPFTAGDLMWTGNPLGLVTISNPAEVFGLLTIRGGALQDDNMNALDIILEDDNGGPIIPEPSSFLLAALGLLSLLYLAWRRKAGN